jgi:transcriptional regulator with XRE-family HTH domain
MISNKISYGETVRAERTRQAISLREMAKRLHVTPTYQSKIERMEFAPPAEDKIKETARILALDPDLLLAQAGKVDSEVLKIITDDPQVFAKFLRAAKRLPRGFMDDVQKRLEQAIQSEKKQLIVNRRL